MSDPRVLHNATLANAFIAKMQVSARYPRVSDQVDTLPIQRDKLVRYGYNPSIVRNGDGLLMAYRFHDGDTLATKLALAELDFAGNVLSNRHIDIQSDAPASFEDPKLFLIDDQTWICWVQSTWPNMPPTAVVKYGRLEGNTVVNVQMVNVPNPKPIEKNHVPISSNDRSGRYFFIYESEPQQIVYLLHQSKIVETLTSDPPFWPYGPIRGGTPPIQYQGKLLRFFHSGLDSEYDGWKRRYFLGAMLMDATPPFRVQSVANRPVAYGSEIDDVPVSERSKCVSYKPRVVFPGGAVEHDGKLLVSVGINDAACSILSLTHDQLYL